MDYKSIQEIQAILYRVSPVCENPCVRVNMHVCVHVCLCVHPWERSRDRWPSPALTEVNGSFAIHFGRRKLGFGQKGTFISTMLILSAFRNQKHLLVLEKKMGRAVGKFSLKGACCYLSSTSFLLKWSGPCEWLWSRQVQYCVYGIPLSRRKHGNSVSHQTIICYARVLDFRTTQVLKIFPYFFQRKGGKVTALHCSLRTHSILISLF